MNGCQPRNQANIGQGELCRIRRNDLRLHHHPTLRTSDPRSPIGTEKAWVVAGRRKSICSPVPHHDVSLAGGMALLEDCRCPQRSYHAVSVKQG